MKPLLLSLALGVLGYVIGLPMGAVSRGFDEMPRPARAKSAEPKEAMMPKEPPERQLRALLSIPVLDRPKGKLMDLMREWAKTDFRGALAFAKALPLPERDEVLADFVEVLALLDKPAAGLLADSIQDRKLKARAWAGILQMWMSVDADEGFRVFESLPLEQMDPEVFRFGNNIMDEVEPELLGRVAVRLEGAQRDAFLNQVFGYMMVVASSDRVHRLLAAMEPTIDDGGRWVDTLVFRLKTEDPAKAGKWVMELPEGRMRDDALKAWSEVIMERDAAQAMAALALVKDEETRQTAMGERLKHWLRKDRAAAVAWLKRGASAWMPKPELERWLKLSGAK